MDFSYFMPVEVYSGKGSVLSHAEVFEGFGKKALIVTGKRSARANGSLGDVCYALESVGISWTLFDRVESNPSIENAREGAEAACESGAEFVIGIGGGSPMDAAKAIAFLAVNEVTDTELFSAGRSAAALPVVAVPTTAGMYASIVFTVKGLEFRCLKLCLKLCLFFHHPHPGTLGRTGHTLYKSYQD